MKMFNAKTVDAFIKGLPKEVQPTLKKIRRTIKKAAPKAQEKVSYGMAQFSLNGVLVYFNAYKTHIGFYPGAAAVRKFKAQLTQFPTSKGTIRFPTNKVPL